MASVSISYTIINLIFDKYNGTDDENLRLISLFTGITFSVLICLSRVYLGMHSILDVTAGIFYSCILSMGFLIISETFYRIVTHNFINGFIIYAIIFVLGYLYPTTKHSKTTQSTARSDTFLILGNF